MWKKLLSFLAEMLRGGSDVSSKRFTGMICIFSILILLHTSIIFDKSISEEWLSLSKAIFWGGTMLLGLGVTERFFKK